MNKTIVKHATPNKQTSHSVPPLKLLEEQRIANTSKLSDFPPVDVAFLEIANNKWLRAASRKTSEP